MPKYKVLEYVTNTATHVTTVHAEHEFAIDAYDKACEFIESYCQKPHPRLGVEWNVSSKPFLSGM